MSVTVANRIRSRLTERRCQVAAESVAKPRVLYCKRNKETKRELAHCDATGFYPPEFIKDRVYNWTDGRAVLQCTLPRQVALRWMWMELASGPDACAVELYFNGQSVLKRKLNGRLRVRIRLPDSPPSNHFTIQIDSNIFVPAQTLNRPEDKRRLGVLVREIRLAKYWWRNVDLKHYLGILKKPTKLLPFRMKKATQVVKAA